MYYRRHRRKWVAQVYFRGSDGRRRFKSKLFTTECEALAGLNDLKRENAELAKRSRTSLLNSIRSQPNSVYECPACREERLFKDRRIVRSDGGIATVICRRCYKEKHG